MKLRNRSVEPRRVSTAPVVPDPRLAEVARARAEQEKRHAALLDSIATTIPVALMMARNDAWDAGWEAAKNGLPKSSNPVRPAL